jgi:hypothetical protein
MAPAAHELRAWAALALPAGLRAFVDLLCVFTARRARPALRPQLRPQP